MDINGNQTMDEQQDNGHKKTRVLLLSLSIAQQDRNEKDLSNLGSEEEYQYTDSNGKEYSVKGYYQLEPVPKILQKMNCAADKIIMLCQTDDNGGTPKVKTPKRLRKSDIEELAKTSELQYFVDTIRNYYKDNNLEEAEFKDVDIDLDKPETGIQEVVDYIRKIPGQIELYLDTHGGLRGLQRVLEAVVSLLRLEEYDISEIFGLEFNSGAVSRVFSEKNRFMMFDFVSGMNEFDNSGKINSLKKFLGNEEDDLVSAIGEVAEGIQWCDVEAFTNGVQKLNDFFQESGDVKNGYLKMFKDKIKNDYGPLIGPHYVSDEIEWCFQKQYYQQALTLIESKISRELLDKNYISVNLNTSGRDPYKYRINSASYTADVELNELWNGYIYKIYSRSGNVSYANDELQYNNQVRNLLTQNTSITLEKHHCRSIRGSLPATINVPNALRINCTNEINELVYLHKLVKNIRNKANHGDKFLYDKEIIRAIIKEYLRLLKEIKTIYDELNAINVPIRSISLPDSVNDRELEKLVRMIVCVFKRNNYTDNRTDWRTITSKLDEMFKNSRPTKADLTTSGNKSVISLLKTYYADVFDITSPSENNTPNIIKLRDGIL